MVDIGAITVVGEVLAEGGYEVLDLGGAMIAFGLVAWMRQNEAKQKNRRQGMVEVPVNFQLGRRLGRTVAFFRRRKQGHSAT